MPKIFKRADSPYWYITYPVAGKQIREATGIHHCGASKPPKDSPIWAHLRKIEERLFCQERGLPLPIQQKLIGGFLDEYMRAFHNHRQTSIDRYYAVVRLFKKWSAKNGVNVVADLTAAKAADFISWRRQSVGGQTLSLEVAWMRAAMTEAKRLTFCTFEENPFNVKIRKEKSQRQPFTSEEIRAILGATKPDWLHTAIMVAMYSGVRIDSIKHLRWEHIVWPAGEGSYGHVIFVKTKTNAFKCALHPSLFSYLFGLKQESGLVLPASIHEHSQAYISITFSNLLKRLGIVGKSFHSFRHTVATRLQACGVEKRIGMAILNHRSEAVHDAYSHAEAEAFGTHLAKLNYE